MALVVLLRGVNVGGHKTFRPSVLAKALSDYDVINIGAAGTFVVRKPISPEKLRTEFLRMMPFEAEVMICDGRDFLKLASLDPFAAEQTRPDLVRFVSVLGKPGKLPSIPMSLPAEGEWLLRVIASEKRFILGIYKR